ncbi:hypothetical protein HZC21_04725 [Candidatus Peregrinibacteria bacterium]|nr:hypothetical protein [Candidatus Peregrinibacteria bacterium]
MKKIIATLLIITFLISGCSLFKRDPKKTVNEGLSNFSDVKKMSYSFVMNGIVKAPAGELPAKTQFNLDIAGKSDSKDKESLKGDMTVKMNISTDEQKNAAELLIKMLDKKVFMNLTKLELGVLSSEQVKTQMGSVLNTWWSLSGENNPFSELTKEQADIKESFKETQFFTNASEEGKEEINGIKTTRYRVELDKEALKKFLLDIARLSDNQPTPEDEIAIKDSLNDLEFSGAAWIGEDDIFHRIKGTVLTAPKQGALSSFDVDYKAWDYGEEVLVSAPESSKEFNPLALLPVLGAFGSFAQQAQDTGASTGTAGTSAIDNPLGSKQVKK